MVGVILGEKSLQSQIFNTKGMRVPTTFIKTENCFLINVVNPQKRGYFAIKLGFKQTKNINKPARMEIKKAGIETPLRFLREARLDRYKDKFNIIEENNKIGLSFADKKIFIGDKLNPSLFFNVGDKVSVTGVSKGKGFQGVVSRHRFKGGSKTHGQSDRQRAPGSIGMTTTPGRVFKGKRMAGRMGSETVKMQNLEVIEIKEDGLLVKGLIPGYKGGLVEIRS